MNTYNIKIDCPFKGKFTINVDADKCALAGMLACFRAGVLATSVKSITEV